MKTKLRHIIFHTALLCSLFACEQVENGERWISGKEHMLPEEERSTILIEEYTGQRCVNCPGAATELNKIAKEFRKNVITVAMHARRTGQVNDELASDDADAYASEYGIPASVPGILINRRSFEEGNRYSQKKALWSSYIRQAVNTKAKFHIDLTASRTTERKVDIRVTATARQGNAASTALGLQLWAVEDIRAEQALPTGKKSDYFHHNVLRGVLNGISGAEYTVGQPYTLQVDVPKTVKNAANSKVVAFLFDRSSKEIYEAAIVALGEGIHPDETDNPNTDNTEVGKEETLTFRYGNEKVASGTTIKADKIDYTGEGRTETEVVTASLYAIPGTKQERRGYTLEITKEDHQGATYGGLSQVCAGGQCMITQDTEKFTKTGYELNEEEFIQIHYKIEKARVNEKADYRVRLSIKQKGEEVAHLHIVFSYDPQKKQEEAPQEPESQPNPTEPSDSPLPPAPINPSVEPKDLTKSNVVAMDFTGQKCGYCPAVIKELAGLEKTYHPYLIPVAIHAPSYAVDTNFIFEMWYKYSDHRVRGYPTVLLNNMTQSNYLDYDIKTSIEKTPALSSKLEAKVEGTKIVLSFSSTAVKGNEHRTAGKKLNVLFWVTENNLKGFQSGEGYNFIHNHVLRGALNGVWGEEYTLNKQISNLRKDIPLKVQKVENSEVIAIVLDASTHEFLDAVKAKL